MSYTLVGSLAAERGRGRTAGGARVTAVVEARGLVKTYGEITAVDHVDLTVEPGDVYGYLGPNGAGKTTSLRMLLGLIRPSGGSARLFGRDPMIDGVRALDGVAGFVEAPRFYPYLSGRKNLELVAALDGGDARSQIDAALDTVDLTEPRQGSRRRLLARHAPAPRHRRRADPPPAAAAARRARHRARPGGHARHARADPRARRQRHHRAALEPPHERGRGALQPRRDHPRGAHRLRGPARRAARHRSRHLHAADVRRRARSADLREPPGHPRASSSRPTASACGATRRAIEALSLELARAGRRAARAGARRGLARGALLRAHRGSASSAPDRRPCPSWSGWRDAAHRSPSTAGSCASSSRRSAPTSASPPRSSRRTIFVVALAVQSGSPNDVPFGRYVRDSGLAAPLVLLTFGSIWLFPLIASLVAGDIVAVRGRQRHAQDHPHAQRHARPGVRRQGRRGGRPTRCSRSPRWPPSRSPRPRSSGASTRSRASRARPSRPGAGSLLVLASLGVYALPLLAITAIGVLLSTVTRNSAGAVVGALMMALLMQLIGILPGRRRRSSRTC